MSKVSTTSLPSKSAWSKGSPQSNSSAALSSRSQSSAPIATSHSRRPSASGWGVSIKDGVSVPRNNVGSVIAQPASVVFGSIDASAPLCSSPAAIPRVKTEVIKFFGSVPAKSSNYVNGKVSASTSATGSSKQLLRASLSLTPSNSSALSSTAAPSTASTPKPSRADIVKLFQNPSSSSSQSSFGTFSPSTRPFNLPPNHQLSSQQLQQPSQLGAHSYSQFVSNGMRSSQQPSGTPRSPAFSCDVPNVQGQSQQGAASGDPGGLPIPASLRMAPHPHQALPGSLAPQVPMSWGGYYYMDPHQPKPPWVYNAMPSQHMHQQSHPQHARQPEPLSMSPRPAAPQLPGTSTMAHAIPHTPHTPQSPPSISSPLSTPSTASAPCLNMNACDFVPGGRPTSKITIRSQDGMEVTLDDLKKFSLRPPTAPISPVVTDRPQPSVLVWKKDGTKKKRKREKRAKRMEEEEAARKRKADENRILMEEEERERIRQAEEEEKELLRQEEEGCLEAGQAHIALEEKERKQQDAPEVEEAQLEAEEFDGIVQTPSLASDSQEPEDGEVSEHNEAPVPQLNGNSGKKLKESPRIDTFMMSPPTEIPRKPPSPIHLTSSAPPPSALLTARVIENLSEVAHPESPRVGFNANVRDGQFRYDRDFLMQFMYMYKEKPSTSIPSDFQMGNFQVPGSKLTSEERFAMSNSRSASNSSASSQFCSPIVRMPTTSGPGHPMHGINRIRSKRGKKYGDANKALVSQEEHSPDFGAAPVLGAGFEPVVPLELSANRWVPTSATYKVQPDVDSPELVDRKVRALLNKLTMEKFETISDKIIHWANKGVDEDGQTLIRVIRLVFKKVTVETAWGEMYARLCQKMMEQIRPEVYDDGIKNRGERPIAGKQLFRNYLLNLCQEHFERRWFVKEATAAAAGAKASSDHATKAANDKKGTLDAGLDSDEYYAAQKAKRQGLNLIKFIGELFKVRMLTERFMHECVVKLLCNIENPEEQRIESLCQMLKTVGQLLDTPQARARMDVYFTRIKELGESHNISTRMQFMLQDVIELRDRIWMSRHAAPVTIATVHALAAKKKAAAEEWLNCQMSMSRGGSQRGGDRDQEDRPDGWVVAGDYVPRVPPKAGDMSPFGNSTNGPPMTLVMSPSGIFGAGKKDGRRETFSRTNLSSNMFCMLSQNLKLTTEAFTKPSHSSSRKSSIDLGHDGVPEPTVQHRKLQLFPQTVYAADESMITPLEEERESAPIAMSEADIGYFTNLPHELRFRLVDNRQILMSSGDLRGGSEHSEEHGPDGWAAPGGSVPWALPRADDLSQFGKISMGASMVMSPSSVFVGRKKDNKQETPSQLNSSPNIFSQNLELTHKMPTKPSLSLRPKPDVDLGHAGFPEPAVQYRKLQLLPRSVYANKKNATTPSKEEPRSTPSISEADVKMIDEDVKEFFAIRNLQEAEVYFTNLPDEHRFRLVNKLVGSALESKEADARLVGDFFAQAMSSGQCTLEVFEKGFMPMAEFLDDIAIDAPKAFGYMAIMLRGAGFENEPERLQRIASKLGVSDKLVSLVA